MPAPVMSRADALALIEWGKSQIHSNPEFKQAYSDPLHPAHAEVKAQADRAFYWAYDHPQSPDGSPVPVEEFQAPATGPEIDADSEYGLISRMSPDEARERIAALQSTPQFAAILKDRDHEDHEYMSHGWALLHQRANPDVSSAESAPLPAPDAIDRITAMQVEVRQQGAKHPLLDPTHPSHAQANAERSALYAAAYPDSPEETPNE